MARKGVLIGLLVAVLASTAWAFEPFFSNAAGQKIGTVWEGQQIYVAIKDPDKGACGIDQFQADLIIFDFKTGAYVQAESAWFRELGGIGSGLYFWVAGQNSNVKVSVQVGSRSDYANAAITGTGANQRGNTHTLGTISPGLSWSGGAWEYVDEGMNGDTDWVTFATGDTLPANRQVARVDFGTTGGFTSSVDTQTLLIAGRFENMDTLVLILRDRTDERNIDQDQVKIVDTVAKLTVPSRADYGCGPSCVNIVVKIEDKDENLNCNEIEYVPFFVIINPGSWNPTEEAPVTNFCSLILRGGNYDPDSPYNEPIRWYNIYEPERYIQYGAAPWWNPAWPTDLLYAVFFAAETSVDSGVFELNFGNLEDLQAALFNDPDGRAVRFPMGTTIAFYYIDPNDFDDMDLAVLRIGNRPYSETFITDANGIPLTEVKLGVGWGGLYVRVYDADANIEACCQDKVVVHICDPHNEDDSEYYVIDEISNNSGIFFTQNGIPLLPVWDAVAGYQLVFDDWRVQAFNEDTIFVRYNSVDYVQAFINALGDGDPNSTITVNETELGFDVNGNGDAEDEEVSVGNFPPLINYLAARNQYWDVSFAKVKVYDYQVFDGTTHRMRFLDGNYQPVTQIAISGSLYLEVTDLDQNEHPGLRELIFGGWNKDAASAQQNALDEDSAPIWAVNVQEGTVASNSSTGEIGDNQDVTDGFTPIAATTLRPVSITGIPASVKIFMWNAQRGTWERMDLRETAVGSGIFRSTTCVLVADARNPGDGNLGSKAGDTIMAFYQDPSNHSDISIISIKVSEGGAGGITPPTVALGVAFDKSNYNPGDTVTITVTDEQYAGASEIAGAAKPLVLKKADGTELASWTTIPAVPGQPGKFRVTYVLPTAVTGTIIAVYTDPLIANRTAQAQATVAAPVLTGVSDVKPVPEVFSTSTTFTVYPIPAGAVASQLKVTVYDLTGKVVATLTGTNTNTVSWTGGNLRNGAYIYVAEVRGPAGQVWPFKGFVYIKR